MKKSPKVVYLEKNQNGREPVVKAGSYGEVAGTCRGIFFQSLERTLRDLFAQVDDDLYKLAENSTSNAQQTAFFDAMRSIRLVQKNVGQAYLQALEEAYRGFWNGETVPSAAFHGKEGEDGLSLVEKEELEEELAVTTMVSKACNNFQRELSALNERFRHMSGRADLPLEGNPVAPAMLATAFRDALSQWDGELLARLVVYKCFDRVVLSRMASCYEAMNRYLAEKGVLPELRHGFLPAGGGRRGSGARADGATDVSDPSTVNPSGGGPEEAELPSLEQMWAYLQQIGAAAGVQPLPLPAAPELPVMSRGSVLSALNRIQEEVLDDDELLEMEIGLQQEFLRQQLLAALGRNDEGRVTGRLAETERQTIDVILALFNHVLDDPNLPDAMRALIGRLQIPVLKAAIADPGFIQDREHPARKLIDDLASASMGWRDDGDRGEKSFYHHVKHAVDRIVHEYRDDISLFEEVRQEFAAYMAQRERVRRIMEERLAQSVSGEERLTVARMKVEELFGELGLDDLPEAARHILEGPWKKLLTILWLREGEEGQNWRKAVGIARTMKKYLAAPSGSYRREELLSEIPEIIGGLKKGFTYISLDQKKSTSLLNGLQGCFIEALRPPSSRPDRVRPVESRKEEENPMAAGEEEAAPEPDEFDRKVAGIGEGTWIRLLPEEEGEEPLVCKLVWRSKYTGTMVFVDGQGNKAAQLKEEALAERFRNGTAALLEDAQAPLIDRALKKMMRVLNAEIVGLRLKMAD